MAIRFSDKYLGGLLGTNELGSIKEETIRAASNNTNRYIDVFVRFETFVVKVMLEV